MPTLKEQLSGTPQGKELLENQAALQKLLNSPDTRKVLQLLRERTGEQLQNAARSALAGDPAALQRLAEELSRDPAGAEAMERLNR